MSTVDNTAANMDLDSLLDATLDDLADVPQFKPFPAGTHLASIKMAPKLIKGRAAMEWELTHLEVVELVNPEEADQVKAGDTCSGAFIFKNEDGTKNELAEGQFKELLKPFAAHFGTASNRETVEAMQGAVIAVTLGVRAGKKGSSSEGKFFPEIKSVVLS